jgi:hypothetical protein
MNRQPTARGDGGASSDRVVGSALSCCSLDARSRDREAFYRAAAGGGNVPHKRPFCFSTTMIVGVPLDGTATAAPTMGRMFRKKDQRCHTRITAELALSLGSAE